MITLSLALFVYFFSINNERYKQGPKGINGVQGPTGKPGSSGNQGSLLDLDKIYVYQNINPLFNTPIYYYKLFNGGSKVVYEIVNIIDLLSQSKGYFFTNSEYYPIYGYCITYVVNTTTNDQFKEGNTIVQMIIAGDFLKQRTILTIGDKKFWGEWF